VYLARAESMPCTPSRRRQNIEYRRTGIQQRLETVTTTLRQKILAGYGLTLAFTMVVLVWAFIYLFDLGRASDAILRENYKSILAAENMIGSIERQDSAILLVMLGYREEGLSQHREYETQFLQWLSRAKDNITIEGEARIIGSIDAGYNSYLTGISQLIVLHHSEPGKAVGFYHETVFPAFRSVRDACGELREINEKTMFQVSDQAQLIAHRAIWSLAVIGIIVVGAGLGFSLVLSSRVTRPLRQIMEAAQKVAERDYDVEITTDSSDELGRLVAEFNAMVRKIKAFHNLDIKQVVAEKQKSEAIIRSIDDGIIVVDAEFKVTDLNPMAEQALRMQPQEARGRHFLEVVKSEELFHYVKQSVASGLPPAIEEGQDVFAVARNHERSYYQFSVTPVHAGAGSLPGVVVVLRDVTKLKELDRMKSEFIMTASHELRTPLTSIGMSVGLLFESAMGRLNEKEQELLAAAQEEVQRLKALVNNLLDLSKIEAGKISIDSQRTPVSLLFEKAAAVLKTQAERDSIELTCELRQDLPSIRADANKITWVLTNLISNALRYTTPGGHIRLSAEQIGPHLHVSVADDGAGIPYEYQARIFDKFVRVEGDQSAGGSGLGLAICKEIIRAHGGTIWVESVPGEGSTFTFTVPVAE
jgi:NtrC-family two-component system sensor histidine kinase KinB